MNQLALFKPVTTFIFDVDGVMTDGSIQILENGELFRTMNIKDGYALQHAIKKNYRIAVISGGRSLHVEKRLLGLGIKDIYLGTVYKEEKMEDYLQLHTLSQEEVLYMGDDLPDMEAMRLVGVPTCPANAVEEIKAICQYISPFNGGSGCVRDVIEKVMKINGDW